MTEVAPPPSVEELLDKIGQLENTVEALSKRLEKFALQEKGISEITDEHLKLIEQVHKTHHIAFCNVFERLRNMEAKLFPNLAADMTAMQSIIGEGDTKVRNPLDHGKPITG